MSNSLSRRSFLKLSGGTAAVAAGLGLTACGGGSSDSGSGSGSTSTSGDVEPQSGSPATTPLDQLPLPEEGKTYNNPKDRDDVQDGGSITIPVSEIGPDWNEVSVSGNTVYMQEFWQYYMPINIVLKDPTLSKYEPNPDYLESIESSEDNGVQTVTVTFKDEAKFNDGTDMDWRCLEAMWKCCNGKDESYTPASTDGWSSVDSVTQGATPKQAVLTLSTPLYPVEEILTGALHPDAADPEVFASGWNNEPHNEWGAGPFIVDSADTTQVTFVPNPNWWGDAPKLDKVTYTQMDSQATYNAFKNGEVDTTGYPQSGSQEMLSNFSGMDEAEIRRAYGASIYNISINTTRDVVSDIAVRTAFAQCLDPSTITSIMFQGVNWSEEAPGSLCVSPWITGYEDNRPDEYKNLKSSDERVAAAKKTLEDAGYALGDDGFYAKDGTTVHFGFTTFGDSNTTKNRAAAIQKMAKDAGMDVEIDNHPSSEFSQVLVAGDWDTVMFGWAWNSLATWYGNQIYGSTSASNYTHTGSAELDAKFAAAPTNKDLSDQFKAFNEAEKEALKTFAFIPVYCGPDVTVVKKGLANIGPALLQTYQPANVGYEKES